MGRPSAPDADRAVQLAVDGMETRKAWELCNKPGGEAGLQNIRKRKRLALAVNEEQQPAPVGVGCTPLPMPAVEPLAATPSSERKNGEKAAFRLSSKQVDKQYTLAKASMRPFIDALKESSAIFHEKQLSASDLGKGSEFNADSLARAYNEMLPKDGPQLVGRRIRRHVAGGWAGQSPPGKGPKHLVPDEVVKLMASHASMSQLAGNEVKPRAAQRNLIALVKGSELEKHLTSKEQRKKFLLRLRRMGGLVTVGKVIVDNRRWMWLTYANVSIYFDGLKHFLISMGFGEDEPEVQPDGSTSELTFTDYMKRRLSCGDETHQRLSNVGDKSGSRATTYIDPRLARSGQRKVESQKHITAYIIMNGFDEIGPYTVIFDTTCDDETDRQINLTWTAGLPRVNAQYGCSEVMTFEPVVLVTPKGGTSEDALEKILLQTIEPLYPDLAPNWVTDDDGNIIGGPICHRLDGGPGRTGTASLPMRMRMSEKGIHLFPSGPQNCTAACQEPDAVFGPYKSKCDDVTDEIFAERIEARAAAETALRKGDPAAILSYSQSKNLPKVELTNADLPRVVNGLPDDPVEKRPFSSAFSRENIHMGNVKVGVVPFTRAALRNPKVRHEIESVDQTGLPHQVATEHEKNMASCSTLQLNTSVLDISLPKRWHPVVAPPTDRETVIRKLADAKCTQSAMWINCGAVAFNGAHMLEAGCEMVQRQLDAKVSSANDKLSNFEELKAAAQVIVDRMRDKQIVSYGDLAAGEPKALVRFYFTAKSVAGIGSYPTVAKQVAFLDGLDSDDLEELLLLDAPHNFKAPAEVESVAAMMLGKISDSVVRTIEFAADKGDAVRCLTSAAPAPAPEPALVPAAGDTISAAAAGFNASVLLGDVLLDKQSPPADLLAFRSANGSRLAGREIVYHFSEGWYRGRVLKQADNPKVKHNQLPCNYRVFFDADDELISCAIYPEAYGWDATTTPVDGWMLLSTNSSMQLALEAPQPQQLALMPPTGEMDACD